MTPDTPQMAAWGGEFGRAYTDRNILSPAQLDALYLERFGVSRSSMNDEFLGNLDRSAKVLEVGSNVGTQLVCLQMAGFTRLYGIELQSYAVKLSRRHTRDIVLVQGSAFDLPFRDDSFDLVFTSGVLIHISPRDLRRALWEIHRCSRRFIWGMEYHAQDYQEVVYRGHQSLLWKADFAALYREACPAVDVVQHRAYPWLAGKNEDAMFLLEKKPTAVRA